MRNYRFAIIGKAKVKAFELTVSQTLSLYFAASDLKTDDLEKFNAILFNCVFNDDDFLHISGKLSDSEIQVVFEFWIKTNSAFFESDKKGGKKFATFKHLYKAMSENVANVARLNHPNVLNYSLSFYLIVLKTLEENNG